MAEKPKYTQQTLGTELRNTWRSIDTYTNKKHNFLSVKMRKKKLKNHLMTCTIYYHR